jgi:competence protein ComEC
MPVLGLMFLAIIGLRAFPELQSEAWALLGVGGLLLTQSITGQRVSRQFLKIKPCLTVIFGFSVIVGWMSFRLPQRPTLEVDPDKPVVLTLEVDRMFAEGNGQRKPRLRGLGTVTQAYGRCHALEGMPIAFDCFLPKDRDGIGVSAVGRVRGVLQRTDRPDAFPFEQYLSQSGVFYQVRQAKWLKTLEPMQPWESFCHHLHHRWDDILKKGSHLPEVNGVYRAMLLGQTRFMHPNQKEAFSRSGTLHLFAISGLHIAVIAGFVFFILSFFPLPLWIPYTLGLSGLWVYIEATGSAPSAKRAFMMVAFWLIGRLLNRQASALGALVVAACIALAWHPMVLYHPGFQLSYAVVAGLILYGVPLGKALERHFRPWKDLPEADRLKGIRRPIGFAYRWICEAIGLSLAASLLSTPLIIFYFKIFSPIGILLNIPLIPLSSLVIILGLVSILSGWMGVTAVSLLLNPICEGFLFGMEKVIQWGLAIPGGVWELQHAFEGWAQVGVVGLIVWGLWNKGSFAQEKI